MSFVEVPSATLFAFLEERGFTRRQTKSSEVVYQRKHHRDPKYIVLVYTSVHEGRVKAAGKGKDAIRVCAVYEYEPVDSARSTAVVRGVCKLPRVHRTGTVEKILERVLKRAREAYGVCNKKVNQTASRATL